MERTFPVRAGGPASEAHCGGVERCVKTRVSHGLNIQVSSVSDLFFSRATATLFERVGAADGFAVLFGTDVDLHSRNKRRPRYVTLAARGIKFDALFLVEAFVGVAGFEPTRVSQHSGNGVESGLQQGVQNCGSHPKTCNITSFWACLEILALLLRDSGLSA